MLMLSTLSTAYSQQYNVEVSMSHLLESARAKTVRVVTANIEHHAWSTYYCLQSSATGVMLGDGLILTNSHVIVGKDIDVVTYDQTVYTAKLLKRDESKDLALLQIDDEGEGFTFSTGTLQLGDSVMSIGNPLGLPQWSFSEGLVTNIDFNYEWQGQSYRGYISNNQCLTGNSGGPLLNANGELVGLVRAKTGKDDAVSVKLEDIKYFLED